MLSYILPLVTPGVAIASLVYAIVITQKLNKMSTLLSGMHERLIKISQKLNAS